MVGRLCRPYGVVGSTLGGDSGNPRAPASTSISARAWVCRVARSLGEPSDRVISAAFAGVGAIAVAISTAAHHEPQPTDGVGSSFSLRSTPAATSAPAPTQSCCHHVFSSGTSAGGQLECRE